MQRKLHLLLKTFLCYVVKKTLAMSLIEEELNLLFKRFVYECVTTRTILS
jgi:hypothetical protein